MTTPISGTSGGNSIAPCLDAAVASTGKPGTGATIPKPARVERMNDLAAERC